MYGIQYQPRGTSFFGASTGSFGDILPYVFTHLRGNLTDSVRHGSFEPQLLKREGPPQKTAFTKKHPVQKNSNSRTLLVTMYSTYTLHTSFCGRVFALGQSATPLMSTILITASKMGVLEGSTLGVICGFHKTYQTARQRRALG